MIEALRSANACIPLKRTKLIFLRRFVARHSTLDWWVHYTHSHMHCRKRYGKWLIRIVGVTFNGRNNSICGHAFICFGRNFLSIVCSIRRQDMYSSFIHKQRNCANRRTNRYGNSAEYFLFHCIRRQLGTSISCQFKWKACENFMLSPPSPFARIIKFYFIIRVPR